MPAARPGRPTPRYYLVFPWRRSGQQADRGASESDVRLTQIHLRRRTPSRRLWLSPSSGFEKVDLLSWSASCLVRLRCDYRTRSIGLSKKVVLGQDTNSCLKPGLAGRGRACYRSEKSLVHWPTCANVCSSGLYWRGRFVQNSSIRPQNEALGFVHKKNP